MFLPNSATIALLAMLVEQGRVVRIGDGIVYRSEDFEEITQRVRNHVAENGAITLAQARDLFETSRRYAQAILEELDTRGVTRRVGDERVLRTGERVQGRRLARNIACKGSDTSHVDMSSRAYHVQREREWPQPLPLSLRKEEEESEWKLLALGHLHLGAGRLPGAVASGEGTGTV